jgi:hypothetical protein
MTLDWIVWAGALTALAAAARSTWSPCGLSMLSSITPFTERSRGHRYWVTATWLVLGALVGGVTLGAGAALLAQGVSGLGLGSRPVALSIVAAACALGAAAVDTGVFGDWLPIIRRQVDDGWLSRYRPWFYGAGFGWQIGVGLATYVMTAAVFLLVALAALTAQPAAAVALGALFGLARGLTVLLTSRARSPERLRTLHRRMAQAGPTVRGSVIAVEIAVAVLALTQQWLLTGIIVGAAAGLVGAAWTLRHRMWRPALARSAQAVKS